MIKIRVRFLGLELALFGVQLARREPSATPGVASGAIRQQSAGSESAYARPCAPAAAALTWPRFPRFRPPTNNRRSGDVSGSGCNYSNVKLSNASLGARAYLKRAGVVRRAETQAFWRTDLVPSAPRFSVQAIFPVVCGTLLLTIAAFATPSHWLSSTATTTVVTILKSSVNDAGQAIRYPQGGRPEVTMLRVEVPPRRERGGTRIRSPASHTVSLARLPSR